MIFINLTLILTITVLALYSLFSLFGLLKKTIHYKYLDELQKKIMYETFSISFIVVIFVHLIQFLFSLFGKDISFMISAGYYQGALITNNPLHIDSFLFDLMIFSVIDIIIKRKYEVLSKKELLLKFVLPFVILLAVLGIITVMLYLQV